MAIRVGIIGCGGIAASHVDGYDQNNTPITALTDLSRNAAEQMAAGIDGARVFDDVPAMLDSSLVDAVSICTPPVAHEEPALQVLAKGIHVLSEKPLAATPEACRSMIEASEKSNAVLMVAFRHRFLPAIRKMKEIIDNGDLGALVYFQNTFSGPAFGMVDKWFSKKAIAGGGTTMDTSTHSIDLFRFLIGEVTESKTVQHTHLEGIDVEDSSIIALKAENGALGTLTASWVAGIGQAVIDITGQDGRVLYDYTIAEEVRFQKRGEDTWQVFPVKASGGFTEEIAYFLSVIGGAEHNLCTGHDGLRAVEIAVGT